MHKHENELYPKTKADVLDAIRKADIEHTSILVYKFENETAGYDNMAKLASATASRIIVAFGGDLGERTFAANYDLFFVRTKVGPTSASIFIERRTLPTTNTAKEKKPRKSLEEIKAEWTEGILKKGGELKDYPPAPTQPDIFGMLDEDDDK